MIPAHITFHSSPNNNLTLEFYKHLKRLESHLKTLPMNSCTGFFLQANTGLGKLVKELAIDEVSGASATLLDKNAHWQLAQKLRD